MSGRICIRDGEFERIFWLNLKKPPRADFDGLDRQSQKMLRKSFEYWIQGMPAPHRHHGFSDPYKDCYVFKEDIHRLYGFLRRSANGKTDLCLICIYAKKKKQHTDTGVLDKVISRLNDLTIVNALEEIEGITGYGKGALDRKKH